jgi:hypothetical protein
MCHCWVSRANVSAVTRFGLRYGAHSTTCPRYHESLDPVDRLYDNDLRRHGEAGRIR